MQTTMIVIWAVVMAFTLLLEFFTVDFFASCFSLAGLVALILAACGVNIYWQVSVFFIVAIIALVGARPVLKRLIKKPTVATNVDQYFGKKARLLYDVMDGESSIKLNDVIWKVACDTALKQGDEVVIERVEGNRMIVKSAQPAKTANAENTPVVEDKKNKKTKGDK